MKVVFLLVAVSLLLLILPSAVSTLSAMVVPLNATVLGMPQIDVTKFEITPKEAKQNEYVYFNITIKNVGNTQEVNVTPKITIWDPDGVAYYINFTSKVIQIGTEANFYDRWFTNGHPPGSYLVKLEVVYDTEEIEIFKNFSVVAPPAPPAPPIMPAPPAIPDLSIEAPKEVVVYVNETGSFLILIQNTGNVVLSNLSVVFPADTITFSTEPDLYDRIGINETKTFLVNILSRKTGEVDVSFRVRTEEITKEKTIKIVTVEREIPINMTEFMEKIKSLEEMLNSTLRVLLTMRAHGYPVTGLFVKLNNASRTLKESLEALAEERYTLAEELFSQSHFMVQETVNKTYEMAKEREIAYSRSIKVLTFLVLVLVVFFAALVIRLFLYRKQY
jgi:hypothetical protein